MSEIPKAYEPQSVEDKWYDFWLKQGCFTADPARVSAPRPAYAIVIPPPNVTGMLHMGHVLNNTIQDILSRKARMDGKEVLWLPGTDHAGIATQVQVEKALKKEERKTKHELGREEFLKRVWQWKEKHGGIIINQLKKLGCSCDWTRERFTMDPEYSRCVQKVFVELYKKGLIYRGKRMVNWCPATQTALSDEEVEMEVQKGFLYYFKVQVVENDGSPVKCDALPLTPALSPRERENRSQILEKTTTDDGSAAPGIPANAQRLSPLPKGEGQGEGKASVTGPVIDSEGRVFLTIATTRPETIPGDTAIAVNPKDPRYAKFIGKHAIRPLPAELPVEKKLIPIIGDEYVDFEFGTGVLKVTPAHDKNDFEIGQRHKLAAVDIMNPNGSMNDLAGKDLAVLDRFEARKVAVEKLKELGALEKEEPYENKIGFSQRARVPIEPRLSEQWFLKYPAVEQSKACVQQEGSAEHPLGSLENETGLSRAGAPRSGKMRFHPQRWAKVYDHWLTNIQDWCISRQLWWGHRIPVWYKRIHVTEDNWVDTLDSWGWDEWVEGNWQRHAESDPNEATFVRMIRVSDGTEVDPNTQPMRPALTKDEGEYDVYVATLSPALVENFEQCGFTQDPDVLDTWFSSWLWPFATMGWPEQTETLKKFYPTTDLVTGPDIIFFWVARMIMAGYEFMGDLPFRNVYFTGIIRDKQGRKMSKTLGNSPDPLELIARYGADALRFGTMRSAPLGQDVLFDEKDVELGRNFCNKLWNACRYRQMQGGEAQGEINPSLLTNDDKWILLKLHQAIKEITEALNGYNFNTAVQTLYRFFWSEYCDWYVEATKAVLSRPASEASPSPLKGERAGASGENESNAHEADAPPHPDPLPPARRGGEGTAGEPLTTSLGATPSSQNPLPHVGGYDARRANTLAVIDFVLSHTLRLFHPFLPFITEELWHGMGYADDMPEGQGGKTIMNAPWPKPFDSDFRDHYGLDDCHLEFAQAKYDLVTAGRNLRRIGNLQSGRKVTYVLKPASPVLPHDAEVIRILLNAEALEIVEDYQAKKGTPTAHTALGELFLPLEGLVDVAAEKARLTKERERIETEILKVQQKLSSPAFAQKAPPQVLQEHQQRLADWQAKLAHVQAALTALE
ncbi:MAG: valine--tRNA ligase [Verrucomicrobiae bacterium]|nr:valine--tRNA ligase [Verrucomicrobiae bacterium]